ncbi:MULTISPECIES: metallophosphoesterase family protein [unclassified Paenibacillus]|uniref:metallophosphoesterase n=1 Tax=unclassified Paenibacillus TaxID=185978 RepID=UPI00020D7406|nr:MULTISPECIES: metallophosphoesterase family protein [unclassified Paenibacillus]EGL17496.1 hypothetical protein HMPREF9413_5408 [Paenibacillus sp. HGF7]EPD81262.1 hypothetical protein HMPREF1207_05019 [Paenibacillus sp. HGH0039]
MIYITGDIHGTISVGSRLNKRNFPEQKSLTKKDCVIIAGDFGLIWDGSREDQYWLKWLHKEKPFTTLFIDGNHENFDLLEQYPVEIWNGGKVHKINSSVIHLMRGQVFTIENKKFFTFGGAASHDKEYRKEGKSWWKREMPSKDEYEEGLENLKRSLFSIHMERDEMHPYFYEIEKKLKYKRWYFGHFHQNVELTRNKRLIYSDLIKIQ